MSSDKEPLSLIQEELFEKYKAYSTKVNLLDQYHNVQVVQSQCLLRFHFSTRSPVTKRNKCLDNLIRLLEELAQSILTPNRHKPLSNAELNTIVSKGNKNIVQPSRDN